MPSSRTDDTNASQGSSGRAVSLLRSLVSVFNARVAFRFGKVEQCNRSKEASTEGGDSGRGQDVSADVI